MKARLICMTIGFFIIIIVTQFIDIGVIANYVQVYGTLPFFYSIYRIEELHLKHKRTAHKGTQTGN